MSTETSTAEHLIRLKAACATNYEKEHGDLTGFNSHWQEQEASFLVIADKLASEAREAAKSEKQRKADQERMANLKRSAMTPKQISDFLQGGHSLQEFQNLPE